MFGQKCANCDYSMGFVESAIVNLGSFLPKAQGAIGMNTLSNIRNIKCPGCGETGRWIRDDE